MGCCKIIQEIFLTFNIAQSNISAMNLRSYLSKIGKTQVQAARELGVTAKHFGTIVNGYPAGRKLGYRIEAWSNGDVAADEVMNPERLSLNIIQKRADCQ